MSLMSTVTKMAIGFAMAKGMDAIQKNGGLGALAGNLTGGGAAAPRQAGSTGGLSDLMGQLGGAGGAGGGLGGMLGQLTGGATGAAGAAGGLGGLGALLGGLAGARGGEAGGGLEALLQQDNPVDEPDEEEVALLMIRAMIQAARADGDIDDDERANLMTLLNDGDPANMAAVKGILAQPVSATSLAQDTPRGMETQVYTVSVNAISPDNQAEAEYLHALAEALGLDPATANTIHDSLGAPRLYG